MDMKCFGSICKVKEWNKNKNSTLMIANRSINLMIEMMRNKLTQIAFSN